MDQAPSRVPVDLLLSAVPISAAKLHLHEDIPEVLKAALASRNPSVEFHLGDGHNDLEASILLGSRENLEAALAAAAECLRQDGVASILVPNRLSFRSIENIIRGTAPLRGLAREELLRAAHRAGFTTTKFSPVVTEPEAAREAIEALQPFLTRLGIEPKHGPERLAPSHFVVQLQRRSAARKAVKLAGGTLQSKAEAMAIVRMQAPFAALATLPDFQVTQVSPSPKIKWDQSGPPNDVFVWQRPLLRRTESLAGYRSILASHHVLVMEFDDHHERFPAIAENDFLTFRAPHAVRTSTVALADVLRPFNPHIFVSRNCIETLPAFRPSEQRPGPVRLLFAALNRQDDWAPYAADLNAVLAGYTPDQLRVDVVFDREFFKMLAASNKQFHPLLPYAAYKQLLSRADLAWLPLSDTLFNRCKSDLKFIECAAHSVAVLASPVVYEETVVPDRTGLLYRSREEFTRGLRALIEEPALRQRLTREAHAYVAGHRTRAVQIKEEANWLRELADSAAELGEAARQRLKPIDAEWAAAIPS